MNYLQKIIDIRTSSDTVNAINVITEGVSIRGYNMWLLFCSAALASIGLDTNSVAVIIGAMLISPLMSPILGIGLSIGIYDKNLFIRSLRNLAIAVVLALTASVIYFSLSPFAIPTAEIEARTYPTLLDVMVALFGGVAGIVSVSRSGFSNALPGVAIATALMPPLCTAGYGIATGKWNYFGGAFYLFFINAVFISLATFIIVKYLQFPLKEYATAKQKRNYTIVFSVLITIVVAPSIYFLYSVYQNQREQKKINEIVFAPIKNQGNEIIKWEIDVKDSVKEIKVYHSGKPLTDSLKTAIRKDLAEHDLHSYALKPIRVNMTKEEVNELSADISRQMFQQLQLANLSKENDTEVDSSLQEMHLLKEIRIVFPAIDSLQKGWISSTAGQKLPLIIYTSKTPLPAAEQQKLKQYVTLRLQKDSVILIRQAL